MVTRYLIETTTQPKVLFNKMEYKIYPASLIDDRIYLEKKRCRAYKISETGEPIPIGIGAFSIIRLQNGARVRLWDIYLKTFYGDFNAPLNCESDLPEYDLLNAEFKYDKDRIFINGIEFRVIPNYYGYFINRYGLTYSILRHTFCKHRIDKDGYHKMDLYPRKDGEYRSRASRPDIKLVHHLVYSAWIEPFELGPEEVIHHKDSIKWHNYPENLEITTKMKNQEYAVRDGLAWLHPVSFTWDTETEDRVCQMMTQGVDLPQMALELGIDHNRDPYSYSKFCYKVLRLRRLARSGANTISSDIIARYPGIKDYTWSPGSVYVTRDLDPKFVPTVNGDNKRKSHRAKDWITSDELEAMKFERSMGVTVAEIARRRSLNPCTTRRLLEAS